MQESTNIGVVSQATQRNIAIGASYRIHNSYGFAGIDHGVVKVMGIILPAEDEDCLKVANDWVDNLSCEEDEAYMEELRQVMDQMWVAYQYTYIDKGGYQADLYQLQYMPLDVFSEHISCM